MRSGRRARRPPDRSFLNAIFNSTMAKSAASKKKTAAGGGAKKKAPAGGKKGKTNGSSGAGGAKKKREPKKVSRAHTHMAENVGTWLPRSGGCGMLLMLLDELIGEMI